MCRSLLCVAHCMNQQMTWPDPLLLVPMIYACRKLSGCVSVDYAFRLQQAQS